MAVLPFGSKEDIVVTLLIPWTYCVLKSFITIVFASVVESGRPGQPITRVTLIQAVGGDQEVDQNFYLPSAAGNDCCRGAGRSLFGVAGNLAILASLLGAIIFKLTR